MIDPDPIIVQLRVQIAALSNRVGGAGALESALEEEDLTVPCAFVVPLDDTADPSQTAGGVTQVLTESFAVVIVADNTNDDAGKSAAQSLKALQDSLFAAVVGWEPATAHWPVEYREGGLFRIARHRIWWQFVFESAQIVQQ